MATSNNGTRLELRHLVDIASQSLDESASCKQALSANPYCAALFEVLCDMKTKLSLGFMHGNEASERALSPDPAMQRLDNMLAAEGVTTLTGLCFPRHESVIIDSRHAVTTCTGHDQSDDTVEQNVTSTDHAEYQAKLAHIRQFYAAEYEKYIQQRDLVISHVTILLNEHSKLRPITANEQQRLLRAMHRKCNVMPLQLKQSACEMVMQLRTRLLDARRKRRNFGKHATQILTQYFNAHLSYPYPSEEVKEELARQCNVTLAQVSNWFGNKRIRYKKNLGKDQNESRNSRATSSSTAKRSAEDNGDERPPSDGSLKPNNKRSRNE